MAVSASRIRHLLQETHELLGDILVATKASDDRARLQEVDWTERHRLHVLLQSAEDSLATLPNAVNAPWFLAELTATIAIVRRWNTESCWACMQKSLEDPQSFAHTIGMLHVAEHLEMGGHKVDVVAEGAEPSPDLRMRAIGGTEAVFLVECYQPSTLCGKPCDLSREDADGIVEKAMRKAKRQVGTKSLGLVAIIGYNQSSHSLRTLQEAAAYRLSKTDRSNLGGIWFVMLGILLSRPSEGNLAFGATRDARFVPNPSYFGTIDIVDEVPHDHPNLIKSPLRDITTDDLLCATTDPLPTPNSKASPTREPRKPRAILKRMSVIQKPKPLSRTVIHGVGSKVPPLFIGKGNTDYHCGRCDVLLAQRVWSLSLSNLVIECPVCRSFNDIGAIPSVDHHTVRLTKGNFSFSAAVQLKPARCLKGG